MSFEDQLRASLQNSTPSKEAKYTIQPPLLQLCTPIFASGAIRNSGSVNKVSIAWSCRPSGGNWSCYNTLCSTIPAGLVVYI